MFKIFSLILILPTTNEGKWDEINTLIRTTICKQLGIANTNVDYTSKGTNCEITFAW